MAGRAFPTGYVTIGSQSAPYMTLTSEALECVEPVLFEDFDDCNIPGGRDLWREGGFYSPGVCFAGYTVGCTKTKAYHEGLPVRHGETAVKCVPDGYSCNTEEEDERYATSHYGEQVLSAPAFEIRWREDDLGSETSQDISTSSMSTRAVPGDVVPITASSTLEADHRTATMIATTLGGATTPSSPSETVRDTTGHGPAISSGSIVGIAVGSTFALLAMALTVVFFMLRHRRSREDRLSRFTDDFGGQGYPDVGLAASRSRVPTELDSSPLEPKELPADIELGRARRSFPHPFRQRAKPLSNSGQPVELPA